MIEPGHPRLSIVRAVRAGIDRPLHVLPRAGAGHGGEPGADAAARRAVPGDAVVWVAADGAAPASSGSRRWSQAGAAADGHDGSGGDLPAAADGGAARGPDLPVSAARSGGRSAEPGLVCGYHLHSDASRLLSCRNRLALRKRPRAGRSAPARTGGGGGGMQVGTRPIADLFIALERGGNVEHRRLGADAIRAAKHIKPFRSEPLHSLASRSTALSPQTRGMCDACSRTRLARRPVSRRGAGA
jgi:hypothetical protein